MSIDWVRFLAYGTKFIKLGKKIRITNAGSNDDLRFMVFNKMKIHFLTKRQMRRFLERYSIEFSEHLAILRTPEKEFA